MKQFVTQDGIAITLTQNAYISGTQDHPYYTAQAVDRHGNEYTVVWDIINNGDDESNNCDWDNPASITKL